MDKIKSLKQRWILIRLVAAAILAAACALVLCDFWYLANVIYLFFIPGNWQLLPLFVLSFTVIIIIQKPWNIKSEAVAAFLNQTYADLEESSELILKVPAELSFLQKLQLSKVEIVISEIPSTPKPFWRQVKTALWFLLAAVIFSLLMSFVSITRVTNDNILPNISTKTPEKVLPQIASVDLTIAPPSYTGRPTRHQDKFTILAEEGATVNWQISTNIAIGKVEILFNDHELKSLKTNANKTQWSTQRLIDKPGFYQVIVDGKRSDLYQIETIKDAAPLIHIKTPKPYTYIDAGEAPKVLMTSTITDDYGVGDAMIFATVAKGSGEGVKFKEYKIPFAESFAAHKKAYDLQHLFELPKLDMEPGDELYFYIEAHDNHQQKTRTDVFTVSIQDTAALLSMDGIVTGSNLKPEFFRSERQIIMDTEKLLKSRDSLSKDKFKSTSGDIGADQKMLRLRYGKFLGEEDESNVGGLAENNELSKAENFSNGAMILDAYTDKHDNAEDATYLEPAIKAQLRATLTEMWNAELHLRMYKPEEALPYEYKALRLLKDLQQKSRSYVAKTAYKPQPLKMEKRMTGDLSKIQQPLNKQELKPGADEYETLKNAVQLLEQIKQKHTYSDADKHILQLAKQQLSIQASSQPGVYLSAVGAANRVLASANPPMADLNLMGRAIQKILPQTAQVPQTGSTSPDMGLAQHYYQNLKRNR